jgi:hypothetical protein
MISYDNHRLIKDLYAPSRAATVSTYHALKGARFVDELLILSTDFELPKAPVNPSRRLTASPVLNLFD